MATNQRTEAATLEKWRVALENAGTQPEIAAKMAELSYDPTKINEGKTLLAQTQEVYFKNKTEDVETTEASELFKSNRKLLEDTFRKHRKRAQVVFRNDPVMLKKLHIDYGVPGAYPKLIETTRLFYTEAAKTNIVDKLARLGITAEDIAAGGELVGTVETNRANYLREVGESEDATQEKDAAMSAMQDWMSEFYAVARIALEDSLQLLEALSKPVKS